MSRFSIERGSFGGRHETVILKDSQNGAAAEIALFGATLLSYRVPVAGKLFDITDGFKDVAELENGKGGRAWIMAPFSNRIFMGEYSFAGKKYAIPMPDPAKRLVMHGFVRQAPFAVKAEKADAKGATVTFSTSVLRPDAFAGYPFAVDVAVTFSLSAAKLDVSISGKNIGKEAAPFGCGWHPYFRTGEKTVDGLSLTIPAAGKIVTGDLLLPVAGADAFVSLDQVPELDFRPNRKAGGNIVGARAIDGAFRELKKDADGFARTVLADPDNGLSVMLAQERGLMHVFTGDTLPSRQRAAIALEPVEFMTNAFNRSECASDIVLAPGSERVFRFGVEWKLG